jgi:hypothetical protein
MTTACQRWRHRRDSYRPAGEPIDPSRYGVEPLPSDREARAFVESHHYEGSMPAAVTRVGLYRTRAWFTPELVGVAVFSVPAQAASIPAWCGTDAGVTLGRLVLLDDVPANGETWFLARAFGVLEREKPDVRAVLSYSDPVARTTLAGEVTTPGHVGTIYQAFNGAHLGRSAAETLWLTPDARVLSRRALSKIRNDERGAAAAYRRLVEAGAPVRRLGEDGADYVRRALAEGPFRRVRHPGNLVYAWAIGPAKKATARGFADSKPYPCPCPVCCPTRVVSAAA